MGPSNRQGAAMRPARKAARKVAVFQRPCGTLSTSRWPFGAQPRRRVMLVFVHVSSMNTNRLGDKALIGPPTRAMAAYVRAVLLARDKRLFLNVTPRRRKKRLIIEVSDLTPRSHKRRSQRA